MKVLFFSNECKFCVEIIKQLKESKFYNDFKLLDIDTNEIPSLIKVVPTIVDPNYKDLLEGKKAFEYLYNKKYFNIPTNNVHLWKDKVLPKPDIEDDKLATQEKSSNEYIIKNETKDDTVVKEEEKPKENKKRIKLSRRNLLLIRGRN